MWHFIKSGLQTTTVPIWGEPPMSICILILPSSAQAQLKLKLRAEMVLIFYWSSHLVPHPSLPTGKYQTWLWKAVTLPFLFCDDFLPIEDLILGLHHLSMNSIQYHLHQIHSFWPVHTSHLAQKRGRVGSFQMQTFVREKVCT